MTENPMEESKFKELFHKEVLQTSCYTLLTNLTIDEVEIEDYENDNDPEYPPCGLVLLNFDELQVSIRARRRKEDDWDIENRAESWEDLNEESLFFDIMVQLIDQIADMKKDLRIIIAKAEAYL